MDFIAVFGQMQDFRLCNLLSALYYISLSSPVKIDRQKQSVASMHQKDYPLTERGNRGVRSPVMRYPVVGESSNHSR